MKLRARILHGIYRLSVKIFLSLRFDFSTWHAEPLPKGPKIFCSNHFSSSDAHFVTTLMKDPLHMVIGPGFGVKIVKNYLSWAEQIPACTKEQRAKVVKTAANYLKQGDSIYIFPEGMLNTMDELIEFKKGIARIYLEYPVPIIPIGLLAPRRRLKTKDGGKLVKYSMKVVSHNYYANIGHPLEFPEEIELAKTDKCLAESQITDKIKAEVGFLINDIKTNKFWS
ncbi:MAG: 1-acyl-sn-glycerol-3-phosphate acyltransferase [Spirochaetales bacterium]|nr:1-acyl-sn-glycerol-3-phosphate acyltransferase [Spirochaetales bacterium]